jgi:hypothetical protein
LTVVGLVTLIWLSAMLFDGSERRNPVGTVLVSAFLLVILASSAWLVAFGLRHRLELDGDRVRVRGIRRWREIRLGEVTRAEWGAWGNLSLETNRGVRFNLDFSQYAIPVRIRLIQRLRSLIRDEVQVGWERFEALPWPTMIDLTAREAEDRKIVRGVQRVVWIAGPLGFLAVLLSLAWMKLAWGVEEIRWDILVPAALLPFALHAQYWITLRINMTAARDRQEDP